MSIDADAQREERRRRRAAGGRTPTAAARARRRAARPARTPPAATGADGEDADARRRAPRPGLAALEHAEDHQGQAAGEQRPRRGSRCGACWRSHALVEVADEQPRRRAAERDVDEEDPAPRHELREHPAERRPDDRRDGPHAGDVALRRGALGHRVDVAGDRDRHRLHGAGAEPLHRAEGDQRRHAPRQRRTASLPSEEQRRCRAA